MTVATTPTLEGVEADETLLRYINHLHIEDDGELKTVAFLGTRGLSVDRKAKVPSNRKGLGDRPPYVGTVEFTPNEYPNARYVADPLDDNPAHTLIWHRNHSRTAQDRMAKDMKSLFRDRWNAREAARRRQEMVA